MPIRNQSSLGDAVRETKKDQNMGGMLLFGKVVKVYQKNHSADVAILNNQWGKLLSSEDNAGKYACKILENYAGFDSQTNIAFGTITPIQVGCTVVVGFINNYKAQPVILGCFHSTDESKNILPEDYPLQDGNEIYRKTVVTRLGDYFTVNSDGEYEWVHHSGAYITTRTDEISDESFSWSNLQLVKNGKFAQSSTSQPLNILAKIQTFIGNISLLIQSTTGMLRLLNSGDSNLIMIEMDSSRNFKIRLQQDSASANSGSSYSQIAMKMDTGDIEITQTSGGKSNSVSLKKSGGISISSDFNISISNSESISITSDSSISIDAPSVHVSIDD